MKIKTNPFINFFLLLLFLFSEKKMAMEEMNQQLNNLCNSLDTVLQNICGPQYSNDLKKFATNHPFILTGIIAVGMFSAIPFLCFLGFTFVTLFIALLCFLCIEGSIIAIAGLIFVGIVSFISIIVGAIISASAVGFWILQKIRSVLIKATQNHSKKVSKRNRPSVEKTTDE
ncbi:uncharacterized protein NPIL_163421 [Nephila pilipes]|uniref:Uncharacterized protein n=1 Tax=Nephila pilipes TaxID=299642 RepID=A0A8X6TRX4_NEPPI|nr:uncharacterized protein NPIL_192191 [Nephila pilipes]GFT40380.1 uncharacterized protein NPIL_163421 [Nephila pilipes]